MPIVSGNFDFTNMALFFGIFIISFIGIIIGVLLFMKKRVPFLIDELIVLYCIIFGITLLIRNEYELKFGAYVIISGIIFASISQLNTHKY